MAVKVKTKEEIAIMRRAGQIVYEVLARLSDMVRPGVSTLDLDRQAAALTEQFNAKPAFLDYASSSPNVKPFPGVICASLNEAIVHGVPDDRPLEEGDIISIDYGCVFQGYYGDSAVTVPVGKISLEAEKLLSVTKQSLNAAISQCYAGKRIGDISYAVQSLVEKNGFSIIREFVGHGIGQEMHEKPHVPNYGKAGQGLMLQPGWVIAIEPMVAAGAYDTAIRRDGWTAVTKDGSLAAHFEHTVAITENEPLILTVA